jgi:hypothetical protein
MKTLAAVFINDLECTKKKFSGATLPVFHK